ncbi:MAG: bifunctional transaldolase/phosoglucose isomerase [Anaerolineales bacterium]|jgi:transaldolase/glucose-6-phosphate isomerase
MSENPLKKINKLGQSIWLDFIRRNMLESGELVMMIREDGLRGVTSNPSIFDKAIAASQDYDQAICELSKQTTSAHMIYERLTVEDIQTAADQFRPVYEETDGRDGYVSLEVSPHLAYDTAGTIQEARRLWSELNRPNVLIKVPATQQGLPAIQKLISEGINVNVTLLFSLNRYREVVEAYISGLEARLAQGASIDRVASVASFFVSRIDVLVDPMLEREIQAGGKSADIAAHAHGQVAISSARNAYQIFKESVQSPRFKPLAEKGARPQRLLWASTSTKNPEYSDVKYVEALIGPETVNTIPLETLHAYHDHGEPALRLEQGADKAKRVLAGLPQIGIELSNVTQQLEDEGVQKFIHSYDQLMDTLDEKLSGVCDQETGAMTLALGDAITEFEERLDDLERKDFIERLWNKDASLWSEKPNEQDQIKDALGWLHVSEEMEANIPKIEQFVRTVKAAGFEHVVHMGMGGSSLAPLLFARTFSSGSSGLPVTVLDSTEPETILGLERDLNLEKTLFIVASKSGKTAETLAFADYFYRKLEDRLGSDAGNNFIAITDPSTPLAAMAQKRGFRHVFLNYPDIGGRYSALSYFGLLPAAFAGVDINALTERAREMLEACSPSVPAHENPGLKLGVALGTLALGGRDKITFLTPDSISTLGMWLEQLLAESTGKQGKGILPVAGEPPGDAEVYGDDRVFVHFSIQDEQDGYRQSLNLLESAGHPVIKIQMADRLDLGSEFVRWEIATAVAGSILEINAFDQPNVQESKDNTELLLEGVRQSGALPEEEPHLIEAGMQVFSDYVTGDLEVTISEFLLGAERGDYVALMAYLPETPGINHVLQEIRQLLRDQLKLATTVGYGPRFLHSTGQLHKGGPNNGLFLQFTADHPEDADIPGEPYSFGVLQQAQYMGDFKALQDHGRRVIRIHLGLDAEAKLHTLKHFLDVGIKSLPLAYRAAHATPSQGEAVAQ